MAKNFARGGATRIEAFDGTWTAGYAVPGLDGTIVGKAEQDTGADRTVTVLKGVMIPIIWKSITSAPAGTVVVW